VKIVKIFLLAYLIFQLLISDLFAVPTTIKEKIEQEGKYILACQYMNPENDAYGAINNIYAKPEASDPFGVPNYIVPRENGMAILGLIIAADVLGDKLYIERAKLSANYLKKVQETDGAWSNRYSYTTSVYKEKSPTQTAEVMIALYKLWEKLDNAEKDYFLQDYYDTMKKGAQYLIECQKVENKKGNDDGLVGAGKDNDGNYQKWRWTHDNSYSYWALKASQFWAKLKDDTSFGNECAESANKIIDGINQYLYKSDIGIWKIAIDENGKEQINAHLRDCVDENANEYKSWIQYCPQFLDIPVDGINASKVGQWIEQNFKSPDNTCTGCIGYYCDKGILKTRKYPGFAFQASLSWFDTENGSYSNEAILWAENSGLWQKTPDNNNIAGGWIDWLEYAPDNGSTDFWWNRFIDSSFYAIASWNGGYDFSIKLNFYNLAVEKNGDGFVWSDVNGIDCGFYCSKDYVEGNTITLTATNFKGTFFQQWIGCDSLNLNKCTISMNSEKKVTAVFVGKYIKKKNKKIKTKDCTVCNGVSVTSKSINDVDVNDWVMYDYIDLNKANITTINMAVSDNNKCNGDEYSGKDIEIRLDGRNGELLGKLTTTGTGGWDTPYYRNQFVLNQNISITNERDVFILFKQGDALDNRAIGNIKEIAFLKKPKRNAKKIKASTYDGFYCVCKSNSCYINNGGSYVGEIDSGEWLKYGAVNFEGESTCTLKIAVDDEFSGKVIDIYINSIKDNDPIGSITTVGTGGWFKYKLQEIQLKKAVTGIRDVYLVVKQGTANQPDGVGNIEWLKCK
jgi:hypothetical protein